jgi:hypothetical protein
MINLDHGVCYISTVFTPIRKLEAVTNFRCKYEGSHESFNKKNYYQITNFAYLHKILLVFTGVYLHHSGARIVQSLVINLCKLEKETRDSYLPETSVRGLFSTQPPIQWVKDNVLPQIKRPQCEVDFSLACSVEVQGDLSFIANTPLTDMTHTETTLPILWFLRFSLIFFYFVFIF